MAEKRLRAKDLRAVPEADMLAQLETLRQELWQHRLKAKEGAQQQTHRVSAVKRQIARIHTVLNEQRHATTGSQKVEPQ